MDYPVHELAKLSGVSTRTLRYYDAIGLLRPLRTGGGGCRVYGPREVDRLQEILFYRALGVPLAEIGRILDDPGYDRAASLRAHLSSLQAERLVRGLSDKSRSVLKAILESEDGELGFWCKSVAEELGFDVSELSGVWSGLTRRTRTVSDDSDAYLIGWAWDEGRDDYYGKLHPTTYRNCKKAMNF